MPNTKKLPPYDCTHCPAYCCGYPIIEVKKPDIKRIARHLQISEEEAKENYTEQENNRVRKMKQKMDKKFNTPVCQFLDLKKRQCTIYRARPQICRDYPGDRCQWHDRHQLETLINNKRVIRLQVSPWTIDGDAPQYTGDKLPNLLHSYYKKNGGK